MQSHQEKGCYQNHLREPEAQTETGLILSIVRVNDAWK